MKIEVLAARAAKRGHARFDYLVGWLPRYAPVAARAPWLFNLGDRLPFAKRAVERIAGVSARSPAAAVASAVYRTGRRSRG